MKAIMVEPGYEARRVNIEESLENLQAIVGGYIQALYPWEDPVAVLVDEDMKFQGYSPNRVLTDEDGEPYDLLFGTFLVVGLTEDNFGSLSDDLAEKYLERFRYPEQFLRLPDGHVLMLRADGTTKQIM